MRFHPPHPPHPHPHPHRHCHDHHHPDQHPHCHCHSHHDHHHPCIDTILSIIRHLLQILSVGMNRNLRLATGRRVVRVGLSKISVVRPGGEEYGSTCWIGCITQTSSFGCCTRWGSKVICSWSRKWRFRQHLLVKTLRILGPKLLWRTLPLKVASIHFCLPFQCVATIQLGILALDYWSCRFRVRTMVGVTI